MTRRNIASTLASSSIIAAFMLLPGSARAMHAPISTDEARALVAREVQQVVRAPRSSVVGPITSTDLARMVAGASLPLGDFAPRPASTVAVTSTDLARAAVAASRAYDAPVALAAAPGASSDWTQ